MRLHKDEALDRLAEFGNVAQFIAYRPTARGLTQSTSRIAGFPPNQGPEDVRDAAAALLAASGERAVNVRSYMPDDPRSREFVYGLRSVEEVVGHLERLGADGLHLILNETVDIEDGGVSGVAQGEVIEFAPDDTPRAVEKPGTASLDRDLGLRLLETIYGFAPELPSERAARVEFSIHPLPRGWRKSHTLLWEIEDDAAPRSSGVPSWPNRFSQHVGDKVFGLLIADGLGFDVPKTTVIGRRVAPFTFGRSTGDATVWIRTAPREPEPGYFTTSKGWRDPFTLLADEDPDKRLASVLAQAAVPTHWSGAAIMGAGEKLIIEGVGGDGDSFMLGEVAPEHLPTRIATDVEKIYLQLFSKLGPVRIEWVHDGVKVWLVQLHVGKTSTSDATIVEGNAESWLPFAVSEGLSSLRELLASAPEGWGIELDGQVGLTSHIADLLRRSGRPARARGR